MAEEVGVLLLFNELWLTSVAQNWTLMVQVCDLGLTSMSLIDYSS